MKTIVISGAIALLSGAAPAAVPLPDAVAAMIEAAAGNADQLRAVVEVAKKTNPGSVAEIEARATALRTAKVVAREQRLAAQGVFNGWSGSGEAGGFISSGNTSNKGVAIGINIVKETRTWKHAVRGQVDYQEDNDIKSRERYFAGYEGNYRVTPSFYVLGTLSYERDIFSGFNQRFAESFGIGYKLVKSPRVQVAIDGGPAIRQTQYKAARSDTSFAGRAGLNAKWTISDALTLNQSATVFYDQQNTSLFALTALTAKVSGALSARLSYQINNESNPPLGLQKEDMTSRVTLVYGF